MNHIDEQASDWVPFFMPNVGGETMYIAEPGDILLYRKVRTLAEAGVIAGELFEDGVWDREYFHVAIALDANRKVEADGRYVAEHPIEDGRPYDVFRLPLSKYDVQCGLHAVRKLIGQRYDWWLIIDDALRYLTKGLIHLPKRFIQSQERRGKICSSLVAYYIRHTTHVNSFQKSIRVRNEVLKKIGRFPPPSPQDIYVAVQEYEVE